MQSTRTMRTIICFCSRLRPRCEQVTDSSGAVCFVLLCFHVRVDSLCFFEGVHQLHLPLAMFGVATADEKQQVEKQGSPKIQSGNASNTREVAKNLFVQCEFSVEDDAGDSVNGHVFRVDCVPPTESYKGRNESKSQFTYTGVHDHGTMPDLKIGSGMFEAIKEAQKLSNEFLTKEIEEVSAKTTASASPVAKKQKLAHK